MRIRRAMMTRITRAIVVMLGSGLFEEKINSLNEGPFVS